MRRLLTIHIYRAAHDRTRVSIRVDLCVCRLRAVRGRATIPRDDRIEGDGNDQQHEVSDVVDEVQDRIQSSDIWLDQRTDDV